MTHASQSKSNAKSKKRLKPWSLFFHQCATSATTATSTTTITATYATTSTDAR